MEILVIMVNFLLLLLIDLQVNFLFSLTMLDRLIFAVILIYKAIGLYLQNGSEKEKTNKQNKANNKTNLKKQTNQFVLC